MHNAGLRDWTLTLRLRATMRYGCEGKVWYCMKLGRNLLLLLSDIQTTLWCSANHCLPIHLDWHNGLQTWFILILQSYTAEQVEMTLRFGCNGKFWFVKTQEYLNYVWFARGSGKELIEPGPFWVFSLWLVIPSVPCF